jgi:hypothetical protein
VPATGDEELAFERRLLLRLRGCRGRDERDRARTRLDELCIELRDEREVRKTPNLHGVVRAIRFGRAALHEARDDMRPVFGERERANCPSAFRDDVRGDQARRLRRRRDHHQHRLRGDDAGARTIRERVPGLAERQRADELAVCARLERIARQTEHALAVERDTVDARSIGWARGFG